jgi:hypothetical protein
MSARVARPLPAGQGHLSELERQLAALHRDVSVETAAECGMTSWALAGHPGSPLALACDDALRVDSPHAATVQEIHLVAIHLLCAAVDQALPAVATPRLEAAS